MVDFQKRDTNRGHTSTEDDADDSGRSSHGHDHDEHTSDREGHHAHDAADLAAAVITVSSSRSIENDPSGDAIVDLLTNAGHDVVDREVVADDFDGVQAAVDNVTTREDVNVVVTTGGTGVTPDDVTIEAVEPLFEKHLPGFGELFRELSYDDIGTRAVATRATAGISDGVPVFCLPGSENAARLGTTEIILEIGGHLAGLARRA